MKTAIRSVSDFKDIEPFDFFAAIIYNENKIKKKLSLP